MKPEPYRFSREWYRPEGSRIEYPEGLPNGYEIHRYEKVWNPERGTTPFAAVFGGNRMKPDWHYQFRTVERREKKIAEWVESQKAHLNLQRQE